MGLGESVVISLEDVVKVGQRLIDTMVDSVWVAVELTLIKPLTVLVAVELNMGVLES